MTGDPIQRLTELATVEEAIKHNPAKVRQLVAEYLGYHELAQAYANTIELAAKP